MKIAAIVPRLVNDINVNVKNINDFITIAYENGASFIVLPEATLTGLINNDVYDHDINIAIQINHRIIKDFSENAKKHNFWLCFGFLEKEKDCIYDSAVLLNPSGEIDIHYRRINPQWRANNLPPNLYSEGKEVKSTVSSLGKTAIVICGDLFDDNVLLKLNNLEPDFVLFPFARCFPLKVKDMQKQWDNIEKYDYYNQSKKTNATVIGSNYIGTPDINDNSFGGAFIINRQGDELVSLPLLKEGILYYKFDNL